MNSRSDSSPAEEARRRDPDAELVRRVRRGDDAAFGRLVDRHAGRLFALAMSMVGNAGDAEDVVQETFTGAFRGLARFRGRATVKTWLTRILIKRIATLRRSQRVRRAASIEDGPDPANPGGGATAVGRADIRMDVATVLGSLSPDHRSIVVLREMQGMSYQQIAEVLAVPRGTVESRLYRARQRLKELLRDYLPQ